MIPSLRIASGAAVALAIVMYSSPAHAAIKPVKKTSSELRADYLAHLNEQYMPPPNPRTTGSLWSAANALGDLSSDYRARNVNDTIIIQVSVQTTAAQSGNVDSERSFTTKLRHHRHRRRGASRHQSIACCQFISRVEGSRINRFQYHLLNRSHWSDHRRAWRMETWSSKQSGRSL